ncbi:MAG TPA: hypothetical protein VFF73_20305 [Planctomycetota bacterium]|nr:hypothetical protein [Planctomycetota bacterium]
MESADGTEIRRATTRGPDQRVLVERLEALEERLKKLPSLTQSTMQAMLEERLGALVLPSMTDLEALRSRAGGGLSPEVTAALASLEEKIAALPPPLTMSDLEAVVADKLASLDPGPMAARVLAELQPKLDELAATAKSAIPAPDVGASVAKASQDIVVKVLAEVRAELDALANEIDELSTAKAVPPPPPPPPPPPAASAFDPAAVKAIVDQAVAEAKKEILGSVDTRSAQVAGDLLMGFGAAEKRIAQKAEEKILQALADHQAQFEEALAAKLEEALTGFVNSAAFKDTLDKRFRTILQHIEADVIPRVTKKFVNPEA